MKKLLSVLILAGCVAMTPAFAAKSKTPKAHPARTAKLQKKHVKKEHAKARKQVRKEGRKEFKSRAKVRRHKSA